MKIVAALIAIACVLSLPSTPVSAGSAFKDEAYCSKQTTDFNGSVIHGCMGTMRGFRNSSDPDAFAQLEYRANGTAFFTARLNGVYFACYFEDGYDTQYFAAVSSGYENSRFVIGSRDGHCDMAGAQLNSGSRYLH